MKSYNITFADQDQVEQYPELLSEFLEQIFEYDISDCLITDESMLSDFNTAVLPDDQDFENLSWASMQAIGNQIILKCIQDKYGIVLNTTHTYIINVLIEIDSNNKLNTNQKSC